jgi:hypothetical protein
MLSRLSRLRSQLTSAHRLIIASAFALLAAATACSDASPTTPDGSLSRQYGPAIEIGNGHVRTYIVTDKQNDNAPVEIGVAFDEPALEGLPSDMPGHGGMNAIDLALPTRNATPYRFVELDWNPHGHEPDGVYTEPHFDFHFYTITAADRNTIDPTTLGDSTYQSMANNLPPEGERHQFFVPLSPPEGPIVAVPRMGAHWGDVRAPELQGVFGHPENARPFTTTFLHGSWNGQFIFDEPMVTRAFILSRKSAASDAARDSVMEVSAAQQYSPAGYRPAAYRVAYDAQRQEYHIALAQLTPRQ